MIQFGIIVNQDIGLARVLAMQAPGILLQGSLPRDWQCQDQGVQRRMIETFAVGAVSVLDNIQSLVEFTPQ
jgi:hypothetical protein